MSEDMSPPTAEDLIRAAGRLEATTECETPNPGDLRVANFLKMLAPQMEVFGKMMQL